MSHAHATTSCFYMTYEKEEYMYMKAFINVIKANK